MTRNYASAFKTLKFFYENDDEQYTTRQIERLTNQSYPTVILHLNELMLRKYVEKIQIGKRSYKYKATNKVKEKEKFVDVIEDFLSKDMF